MTARSPLPLALLFGLLSAAIGVRGQEPQPRTEPQPSPQPPSQPADQAQGPVYVFGTTVVIPSGLKGTVYYIPHGTKTLAQVEKGKPRGTIYVSSLNIPVQDYKLGFPGIGKRLEWFAIDYTGRFWIANPGVYRWELTSDDGSLLFIDNKPVIDNWGLHSPQTIKGSTRLAAGVHTLRVAYFQGIRYQVALTLEIAPPGEPFRVFSTDEFKPPPDADAAALPETPANPQ